MESSEEVKRLAQVHKFLKGRCLTCDTRQCSALGGDNCPCCGRDMKPVRAIEIFDRRNDQGI